MIWFSHKNFGKKVTKSRMANFFFTFFYQNPILKFYQISKQTPQNSMYKLGDLRKDVTDIEKIVYENSGKFEDFKNLLDGQKLNTEKLVESILDHERELKFSVQKLEGEIVANRELIGNVTTVSHRNEESEPEPTPEPSTYADFALKLLSSAQSNVVSPDYTEFNTKLNNTTTKVNTLSDQVLRISSKLNKFDENVKGSYQVMTSLVPNVHSLMELKDKVYRLETDNNGTLSDVEALNEDFRLIKEQINGMKVQLEGLQPNNGTAKSTALGNQTRGEQRGEQEENPDLGFKDSLESSMINGIITNLEDRLSNIDLTLNSLNMQISQNKDLSKSAIKNFETLSREVQNHTKELSTAMHNDYTNSYNLDNIIKPAISDVNDRISIVENLANSQYERVQKLEKMAKNIPDEMDISMEMEELRENIENIQQSVANFTLTRGQTDEDQKELSDATSLARKKLKIDYHKLSEVISDKYDDKFKNITNNISALNSRFRTQQTTISTLSSRGGKKIHRAVKHLKSIYAKQSSRIQNLTEEVETLESKVEKINKEKAKAPIPMKIVSSSESDDLEKEKKRMENKLRNLKDDFQTQTTDLSKRIENIIKIVEDNFVQTDDLVIFQNETDYFLQNALSNMDRQDKIIDNTMASLRSISNRLSDTENDIKTNREALDNQFSKINSETRERLELHDKRLEKYAKDKTVIQEKINDLNVYARSLKSDINVGGHLAKSGLDKVERLAAYLNESRSIEAAYEKNDYSLFQDIYARLVEQYIVCLHSIVSSLCQITNIALTVLFISHRHKF